MLKKGLFGILILTLGIMLVFSLSGCRLDSLLSGLIDDAKDDIDDPYGEKYPAGYPSGGGYPSDSSYDPNGTWSFYINSDSATLTISNNSSWNFSCNQTSDSGTLYANGSHYTLHSNSSDTDIGTAVMTGYSSMTLTLTTQSIAGVYSLTKSGW